MEENDYSQYNESILNIRGNNERNLLREKLMRSSREKSTRPSSLVEERNRLKGLIIESL